MYMFSRPELVRVISQVIEENELVYRRQKERLSRFVKQLRALLVNNKILKTMREFLIAGVICSFRLVPIISRAAMF